MTIEQYAAEQGYKDITRYTLENGVHVYRLQNKDADKKIGLPFFALETADGYQRADTDTTLVLLDAIYGDAE